MSTRLRINRPGKLQMIIGQILFVILVVSLIFLGTNRTIDLPSVVDRFFDNFFVKITLLVLLAIISRMSLPIGILFAVLYIVLSERVIDNDLEKSVNNIVNSNEPTTTETEEVVEEEPVLAEEVM